MTKNDAIREINRKIDEPILNNHNTHFANLNSAKDVWWFDIPTSKAFSVEMVCIHLLVYNSREQIIYRLKVPTSLFRENRSKFIIREEKATISLELSARRSNFLKDVRPGSGGVAFIEFVQ